MADRDLSAGLLVRDISYEVVCTDPRLCIRSVRSSERGDLQSHLSATRQSGPEGIRDRLQCVRHRRYVDIGRSAEKARISAWLTVPAPFTNPATCNTT